MLRGNVDTRLAKLDAGACDATVLAAAGLERLGLESRIRARLAPRDMLPAIGQGIVGVECLEDREDIVALLRGLEHGPTRSVLAAERALAARIGASCHSPDSPVMRRSTARRSGSTGSSARPTEATIITDAVSGAVRDAAALGAELAERLLAAGAGKLL